MDDTQLNFKLRSLNDVQRRREWISLGDLPPNEELGCSAPSAAFIADMDLRGQVVPITVVQNGHLILRDGRTRVWAARSLGWANVLADVFEGLGEIESIVLASASNHHRRSNPLTDLAVLQELERRGLPLSLSGLPKGTIDKALKFRNLEDEFVEAVQAGHMSVAAAEKATTLRKTTPGYSDLLDKARAGERITTNAVMAAKTAGKQVYHDQLNVALEGLQNTPRRNMYIVVPSNLENWQSAPKIFGDLTEARQAQSTGCKLYQLTEV